MEQQNKQKPEEFINATSKFKLVYQKMDITKVNRLKQTSGMVDIVNASSHDFKRPPMLAKDLSKSSSQEESAFHESKLINTPIEAQSLDNSTERVRQMPIDDSPRIYDLIQQQEQTIFQPDGTQNVEQKRYQSPLDKRIEIVEQNFQDNLQNANQISLGMKFDSPREHKKIGTSIERLSNGQTLRQQKKFQMIVPVNSTQSISMRTDGLSKMQTDFKKALEEEDREKEDKQMLKMHHQFHTEKKKRSSSLLIWGMSISLQKGTPPLKAITTLYSDDKMSSKSQQKSRRQSVILRRQVLSSDSKNLNDILTAERFAQIEKLNPHKDKESDKDNDLSNAIKIGADGDDQIVGDDAIIVPIRRARSLKVEDPLRHEDIYRKYMKDNAEEYGSVNQEETLHLVGEAEKALMIEQLKRKDIDEEREREHKLQEKLEGDKKATQGTIKLTNTTQSLKNQQNEILNADQSSSETSSFDLSEQEADPEEYDRKKAEKKRLKVIKEERMKQIKEERLQAVSLIKKIEHGSYYSSLLKQRGQDFTTNIQKFDAVIANSHAMRKTEQKLVTRGRQRSRALQIFQLTKVQMPNNDVQHHESLIDNDESVVKVNPGGTLRQQKRLIRTHTWFELKNEGNQIQQIPSDASEYAQDQEKREDQKENKKDEAEQINQEVAARCEKQKEVKDLIESKIDFSTLQNLQKVKLKRRFNEEIRKQKREVQTLEEQMTSNYKVFEQKNRMRDKQHSNQLNIEDYRETQDKNIKLKNQNKIITDDLGEEAFTANSGIVDAIKEAWLLQPNSSFIKGWQILLLIALLYCATLMPYKVCFIEEHSNGWLVFDSIIDFIFICDIIFVLNTPFIDLQTQQIVLSRKSIFLRYLKGWLLIDIASSIPLDLILYLMFGEMQNMQLNNDILKLLRVPRIYRVMRVARIFRVIKLFQNMPLISQIKDSLNLKVGSQRMLEFAVTTFVMVHLVACFWYFIAAGDSPDIETWLVANNLQDETNASKYLASMYWGYTTMLTVGYGDITPKTDKEYIFSMIWMIMGAGIYTQVIGNLASVLATLDTREGAIQDKISTVDEFCKEAKISGPLRTKLRDAIEYSTGKNFFSWVDKQQILSELPAAIRCEISLHMHGGIVKKINFFQDKDQTFIGSIVPLLLPFQARKDDLVYIKSQHSSNIFFITKGRVTFCLEEESDIGYLDMIMGSYFGEIEVIQNIARLFSVKASEYTDFLTLSKQVFEIYLMNEYPAIFEEMSKVAILRQEKISVAEQFSIDIVDTVQLYDISNMKPEDFERLMKPQQKQSKTIVEKVKHKTSIKKKQEKATKKKTLRAINSKLKKSLSLKVIKPKFKKKSVSVEKKEKSSSSDSEKISNSFSFEESSSDSSSSSDNSHSSSSQQENYKEENTKKLRAPKSSDKFKEEIQKKEAKNGDDSSKDILIQKQVSIGSETDSLPKPAMRRGGSQVLTLVGEGVLENLESNMQEQQLEEERKLKEQQKENERRLNMLKQLNRIKKQKRLQKEQSTLEGLVDMNQRVSSVLHGSAMMEQSNSKIQSVIQHDLKSRFKRIKQESMSGDDFNTFQNKRQLSKQSLPQITPDQSNLVFKSTRKLYTDAHQSDPNSAQSQASKHPLHGLYLDSGMTIHSVSPSPATLFDIQDNAKRVSSHTFAQNIDNKACYQALVETNNKVDTMHQQLTLEIQQSTEVDAKVDDLLSQLNQKFK